MAFVAPGDVYYISQNEIQSPLFKGSHRKFTLAVSQFSSFHSSQSISLPYSHVKFLTLQQVNTIMLRVTQQLCLDWNNLLHTAADFAAHVWNKAPPSPSVSPHVFSGALCFHGDQTLSSPSHFCLFFLSFICYLPSRGVLVRKNACATWYSIFVALENCAETLYIHIVTKEHLVPSEALPALLCTISHIQNLHPANAFLLSAVLAVLKFSFAVSSSGSLFLMLHWSATVLTFLSRTYLFTFWASECLAPNSVTVTYHI